MPYYSWGFGNCAGLPALSSVFDAKKHYEEVKPIRGRNPEVRPLGRQRRYTWYEIRKNNRVVEDGFLGQYITTYSCTLYHQHDCVEFYPDGTIAIRAYGWHTPTTMAFINYVTHNFGYIESVKGKWYWKQLHDGNRFLIKTSASNKKGEILLKLNEKGKYVVQDPLRENRYKVSRKAINAVRKKYMFFSDYCRAMLSMNPSVNRDEFVDIAKARNFFNSQLTGNTVHYHSATGGENIVKKNRDILFTDLHTVMDSGDLELMYSLAVYVSYSFGRWSYRDNSSVCKPEGFDRQWTEVLKYKFAEEVMVAEEVELGVGFKDGNTKYM